MRYFITILLILISLVLTNCSSDPVSSINFENGSFQLEESIADTAYTLNTQDGTLLAGTVTGAYKKSLEAESRWHSIGLQVDSAEVVDFIMSNSSNYIAAVNYEGQTDGGNPVLFETKNGGDSWSSISVTYDEELRFFQVLELEKSPESENHLFADAGGIIMKSTDRGRSWSNIFMRGGMTRFLHQSEFHPQQLWSGGQTNIFSPHLAKSENGGQNWTLLNENFFAGFNTETIVQDAILHPEKSTHVLVGAGGAITPANVIRKSTDGGQSWETVLEGINTRTLTHSARNPEIVYASGRNANGSLFFAASSDFGQSWERVEWTNSPAGVQVNDMVSVMEGGREVLYFGTNKGMFSYTFEEE